MATDGVEILDGDLAYSIYNGIMELFNNGIDKNKIIEEYPLVIDQEDELDLEDEFEDEVYFTVVGLAFWEIGILTDNQINLIEEIIDRQAGFRFFSQETEEEGINRKGVLKDYLKKIKSVNTNIKKIDGVLIKSQAPIFDENDVILIQLSTDRNGLIICNKINHINNNLSYSMILTDYLKKENIHFLEVKNINFLTSNIEDSPLIKFEPSFNNFRLMILNIDHEIIQANRSKFKKVGKIMIDLEKTVIGEIAEANNMSEVEKVVSTVNNYQELTKYSLAPLYQIIKQ